MARKKASRADKFFSILEQIVTLPFRLVALFIKSIKWLAEKNKQRKAKKQHRKVEEKRHSIPAAYQPFTILLKFSGDLEKWERKLPKSTIGIILGARGKGKTALGVRILENLKAKHDLRLTAMGFNEEDMPGWIDVVDDTNKIKNNSFVLIDEGGVLFSSRKSMTNANQVLSDLIMISRHKNLSILFISQNSANLDVNILRQADYLLLKPSSLLQKDFERKKIQEVYEEVKQQFDELSEDRGLTYVYSEEFRGFVSNPLPSFWNLKISKAFKK